MRESPFWLWYKGTGGREEGTKPRLPPPLASLLACASSHAPSSFSFSSSEASASATSQHTRKGKAEGKGERKKRLFRLHVKWRGGKHGGTVPSSATLSSRDGAISSPLRNRKLKSAAKAEGREKLFSLLPLPPDPCC